LILNRNKILMSIISDQNLKQNSPVSSNRVLRNVIYMPTTLLSRPLLVSDSPLLRNTVILAAEILLI